MRRVLRWPWLGLRVVVVGFGVLIGGLFVLVIIATALKGFEPDKGSATATKAPLVQRCLHRWNAQANRAAQRSLARRRRQIEGLQLAYDRAIEECTLDVKLTKGSAFYESSPRDGAWDDVSGGLIPSSLTDSNVRLTRLGLVRPMRQAQGPGSGQ